MASRTRPAVLSVALATLLGAPPRNVRAQPPPADAHAAPGPEAAHPAPGHDAAHPAPGHEAAHPAPGHEATHAAPGHEATHATPGHEAAHTEHAGATAHAEAGEKHAEGEEHEHHPAFEVGIDLVIGSGRRAPEGEEEGERVTATSSVIEASYGVGSFRLGVLVPLSQETISRGDESYTRTALGNLALAGHYEHEISPFTSLRASLTLAAPTAAGDRYATFEGRAKAAEANEWAALSRAYAEDELFAPHHVCAVPALGLDRESDNFDLGGLVKMPLLTLEGGTSGSAETGESSSPVAVEIIPSLYGFYKISPAHLAFGATAYAVYFAVDEVRAPRREDGREEPKLQPVFEPEARVIFDRFRLSLGYVLPIGGRLGGQDRRAGGVRFALVAEI